MLLKLKTGKNTILITLNNVTISSALSKDIPHKLVRFEIRLLAPVLVVAASKIFLICI